LFAGFCKTFARPVEPKTWEELQQNRGTGYDKHHIVEQWSEKDGIPRRLIDAPENSVSIPTVTHWEINRWLDKPNDDFLDSKGNKMSPREYLRGKSWEERYQFGIDVLVRFKVLKP
jgi:hypothetical protein